MILPLYLQKQKNIPFIDSVQVSRIHLIEEMILYQMNTIARRMHSLTENLTSHKRYLIPYCYKCMQFRSDPLLSARSVNIVYQGTISFVMTFLVVSSKSDCAYDEANLHTRCLSDVLAIIIVILTQRYHA